MLILNADEVAQALPMGTAVEAMKRAFVAISDGTANLPLRTHIDIQQHAGTTLIMPAYVSNRSGESLTVKVVSVFGKNTEKNLPRIQAAVIVLDPETGQPVALIEGSTLTGIRTAAASGAATDVLARNDATKLAILGAGVQARTHISAMLAVRPIENIFVWSHNPAKVSKLIDEFKDHESQCHFEACQSSDQAVENADIVCTVTTAAEPLFDAESVRAGTHFNVVGSYQPHVREVPTATVVAARVFVDEVASALAEAGDLIQPIREGAIVADHILGSVGQVLQHQIDGRLSNSDITLFKSVGNAAEDALAADATMANALQKGLGTKIELISTGQ